MDILLPEFKQLLLLLNKFKVTYMLIGGYAVIYYGYERNTTDMDIWLKPENDNRDALISALKEFGIEDESLNKISFLDFTSIHCFHFGHRPRRIDFLTHINGVPFDQAEKKINYFSMADEKIPIIDYHHLILSKISNKRPQDIADIDQLQKINQFKKNPEA